MTIYNAFIFKDLFVENISQKLMFLAHLFPSYQLLARLSSPVSKR